MILRTVSESSTIMTSGGPLAAALAAATRVACAVRHHHRLLGLGVDALGQLHRIDDQHDLARSEHRRAGNAGNAGELRADVLHHDFLVADHLVDVDRGHVLAAAAAASTEL